MKLMLGTYSKHRPVNDDYFKEFYLYHTGSLLSQWCG